jgi:LDH2 family malate/lactate/ureidoglycolate dehydrogenase
MGFAFTNSPPGMAPYGGTKPILEDFSGPQRLGHVFVAMRPDPFMPLADFKHRLDTMLERFKASEPADAFDEVLMPGESEAHREVERRRTGLPITTEVLASIQAEAAALGIPS